MKRIKNIGIYSVRLNAYIIYMALLFVHSIVYKNKNDKYIHNCVFNTEEANEAYLSTLRFVPVRLDS